MPAGEHLTRLAPVLSDSHLRQCRSLDLLRYFTAEKEGWRCVEGILVILTGALWFLGMIAIPEACALVLPAKMSIAAASVNR
jgi:hypothetical protein